MQDQQVKSRLEVAIDSAREAGKRLLSIRSDASFEVSYKSINDPVTTADKEAENIIISRIQSHFPDDKIVSEESPILPGNTVWAWFIDPMDGTKQFISGFPEYTVMIGITKNAEPVAGVIYNPSTDLLHYASQNILFMEHQGGSPQMVAPLERKGPWKCASSRSHPSSAADLLMQRLQIQDRIIAGGVGNKLQIILSGKADLYAELDGGTKKWDVCATVAIAQAAGLTVLDKKGHEMDFNSATMRNESGVLIGPKSLVEKAITVLADILPD